eukprot:COSAG01_NODE_923_length_12710_cov_68.328919_2_plen_88_part_00
MAVVTRNGKDLRVNARCVGGGVKNELLLAAVRIELAETAIARPHTQGVCLIPDGFDSCNAVDIALLAPNLHAIAAHISPSPTPPPSP